MASSAGSLLITRRRPCIVRTISMRKTNVKTEGRDILNIALELLLIKTYDSILRGESGCASITLMWVSVKLRFIKLLQC